MHTEATDVEAATLMITWPADQLDQLRPMGDNTGLFESPDGRLYANLGAEGHFQVRHTADDSYQVPLPFSPDLPGPTLVKIEGQPIWRIIPPNWLLQSVPEMGARTVNTPPTPQLPTFITPHTSRMLTAADSAGIRYDKLKKRYVDVPEGTAMVFRHPDGEYQLTSVSELLPSGPFVEQIPGTMQWRLTTRPLKRPATSQSSAEGEPTPSSSKRTRPEENQHASSDDNSRAENLLANES